jgi:GAF domain-containing protein
MLAADGASFIPLAGYHVPPGLLNGLQSLTLDSQHPLIQQTQRLGAPLAFPDSANDPRVDHPILRLFPHRSLLVCPMSLGGEIVGGFAVGWLERPHVFPDDELRLVEGMARQAAAGIANARLVAAERKAGEHLAASETRSRSWRISTTSSTCTTSTA